MKNKQLVIILGLVILHMVMSILWYGAFSQEWLEMSRLTEEQAMGIHPVSYVLAALSAGLSATVLWWLFQKMNVKNALDGAKLATIIGISFFFLELIVEDKFSVRPLKLSFINGGNYLLYLIIAGGVLGHKWGKK